MPICIGFYSNRAPCTAQPCTFFVLPSMFKMSNTTKAVEHCYHCGGECPTEPIIQDEHPFCCDGCETVYELLKDKQLTKYYQLESAPARNTVKAIDKEKYAFLDLPAIQEQLIEFREGGLAKITLLIPPIHCSSCIWLLENLTLLSDGVQSAQVNFLKKEATILFFEDKLTLRQLVELLLSLGYEPHISLASSKEKTRPKVNRSLYYKIGVAGFCFGNIMLLSFPEYVSARASDIALEYRQLFSYLSFALALPILFYCSTDYFRSALQGLRYRIMNIDIPISLGIFALFGQSSYEIFTHTGAGYMDSLAGLLFFLLIGKWYQNKVYTSLSFERDYESYFPIAVSKAQADGTWESVPVQELGVGDTIRIRNKEVIPADAVLVSDTARIDYSFVSGESLPVDKIKGDKIYAGGRQLGRSIELTLTKEVSQSHLTQLWNQSIYEKQETNPYRHFSALVERVSRRFTIIVLAIALVSGLYWFWQDSTEAIMVVTSVLIITCPCALALSMPVATGSAIRWLGRQQLYLKNAITVERLSEIDSIVFDKTGTLTHSQLSKIEWQGAPLSTAELSAVKSIVQHSTHPLSVSLFHFLDAPLIDVAQFDELEGKGIEAQIGDKPYRIGSRSWVGERAEASNPNNTQVYIAINGEIRGCFILHKTYREGLETLFAELGKKYDLYLLSGDNESEKEQLLPFFKDASKLRFHQSPMDKLQFVQSLEAQGKKVLMVGDGLNDAGALRASHAGIAVVEDIHSFSPASDAILDAANLPKLHRLLQFAKDSMRATQWSFIGSLTYNVIGLSFAVRAALTPLIAAILMPLSSVTVVAFITIAIYMQAKKME